MNELKLKEFVGPLKELFEKVQLGVDTYRRIRITMFFETIKNELQRNGEISEDVAHKLLLYNKDDKFLEFMATTMKRVIVAESTLSVRMIAIKAAQVISNGSETSYFDLLTLRGLEKLTDVEIILGNKLYELYFEGKFPPPNKESGSSKEYIEHVKKMISPTEHFFKLTNQSEAEFCAKVEMLKQCYIFDDAGHGAIGVQGGFGYCYISERSKEFSELYKKTQLYK